MSDGPPKSAVELAMEKLAKQDADAGIESRSLTIAQKEAISEIRRNCEAQMAEYRVLHDSKLLTVGDPDARSELEANYRREILWLVSDRDRKIDTILNETE